MTENQKEILNNLKSDMAQDAEKLLQISAKLNNNAKFAGILYFICGTLFGAGFVLAFK